MNKYSFANEVNFRFEWKFYEVLTERMDIFMERGIARKTLSFLLCITLLTGLLPEFYAAASEPSGSLSQNSSETMKPGNLQNLSGLADIYIPVLKEAQKYIEKSTPWYAAYEQGYTASKQWYTLFDIDGDGIKELIYEVDTGVEMDRTCYVYTVGTDGTAIELGFVFSDSSWFVEGPSGELILRRDYRGGADATQIKIADGSLIFEEYVESVFCGYEDFDREIYNKFIEELGETYPIETADYYPQLDYSLFNLNEPASASEIRPVSAPPSEMTQKALPTEGRGTDGSWLSHITYNPDGQIRTAVDSDVEWDYVYSEEGNFKYRMRCSKNVPSLGSSSGRPIPGTDITYKVLSYPVDNCVGFSFDYRINYFKSGSMNGDRWVYISGEPQNGQSWKCVGSFEYDVYAVDMQWHDVTIMFDEPQTLSAFGTPRVHSDNYSVFDNDHVMKSVWIADYHNVQLQEEA